jgi:hypothetical protein
MACLLIGGAVVACDKEPSKGDSTEATRAPSATATPVPPEPPRAPDIVIDAGSVSIGNDHVATGEPGLADKIAVFVTGRPMIEGHVVDFVAMRNAKPSHVVALVAALRKAKATSAVAKSEARDGTTQKLPVSFTTTLADCTTVAWIARDAAIDVWPAGGATAKRIIKGLAGPDMTLGSEAVRKQATSCTAPELVIGADDVLTWGLVFDLATTAVQAPGARVSTAVLVTNAVPGRKVTLE